MNTKHDCYQLAPTFLLWLILLSLTFPGPVSADSRSGKSKMVDLWQPVDSGQRMRIRGRVTSIDGHPMPNLVIGFRHVHVTVDHDGYQYLDTEFHFKHDPKAAEDDPDAIFLEAGTVDGETMMYCRYDITLIPR